MQLLYLILFIISQKDKKENLLIRESLQGVSANLGQLYRYNIRPEKWISFREELKYEAVQEADRSIETK